MSAVPFRFYLISHRLRMGPDPAGAVAALAQAGLPAFQWREKDLSPVENLGWLRGILDAVRKSMPSSGGITAREPASGAPVVPRPGREATAAPPGGVHYPWQIAPRVGRPETRESIIHHRAPHGLPESDSQATASDQGATAVPGAFEFSEREDPRGRLSLFVNDRADLALAAGCNLHLAETSISTVDARAILPAERWIGRSVHSLDGALHAARDAVDFITFGPVYETPSKLGYGPPQGLERLREICAAVVTPVFAIGGVTRDRVAECREAGAYGVAAIGAVWEAAEPIAALRACLDALAEH